MGSCEKVTWDFQLLWEVFPVIASEIELEGPPMLRFPWPLGLLSRQVHLVADPARSGGERQVGQQLNGGASAAALPFCTCASNAPYTLAAATI